MSSEVATQHATLLARGVVKPFVFSDAKEFVPTWAMNAKVNAFLFPKVPIWFLVSFLCLGQLRTQRGKAPQDGPMGPSFRQALFPVVGFPPWAVSPAVLCQACLGNGLLRAVGPGFFDGAQG